MSWTRHVPVRGPALLYAGLLVLASVVVPQPAARADDSRVETPVATSSPITEVVESVVKVKVPLPDSVGPHPAACEWLSYLRFRHKDGPSASASADRILIAQPGVLEGAGAFDSVARNTIKAAAAKGRHIEFWALDRRSNCLEDGTGLRAGLAAKDPHVAIDYYYRGKVVDGAKFAGYQTNDQVKWLQNIGLEQTVRDQYDLMVKELPGQALRKQKVLCGGHSLGGVLTGFFAVWDFDGDHATTGDAGYNQCSGYFALDTSIQAGPITVDGQVPSIPQIDLGPAVVKAGLESGIIPRTLSAPAVINSETMNLLAIAGLAARVAPEAQSDLAQYIPSGFNQDTTYRVLFSKNLAAFVAGSPTIKDFKVTNSAALGALMDDNSQPLGFIQASVGFFDGGKIADKDFPLPNDLAKIPGLELFSRFLGNEKKAIPDQPAGPLYTWRNYDRVGALDDPVYKSKDGTPFTTAAKEVTDVHELARSLSEHPLDFTEHYFPTRMVTDIQLSTSPALFRDAVHKEGLTANPTINLLAGDGLFPREPGENVVIAAGYQHLDVLTAAPVQNGGGPEPISVNLADFSTR
ncbi:hypothetical protein ACRYCC_10055 [Actinomadura scrupuli]|uniref:hypothetical protein n=1 Tax=Actinomadura scrupuli TaxID=559629 RepID=UPI003D984EA1